MKVFHESELEEIRDDVSCPEFDQVTSKLKLSLFACPSNLAIGQQVSESSAISTEMTQDHYITEPRHPPSPSKIQAKKTLMLPLTQKYLTSVQNTPALSTQGSARDVIKEARK